MRYLIVIEKAERNYSAYAPDVPGCVAAGKNIAETVQLMREALEFHFAGMAEDDEPIPDPATISEYIDVQLPLAEGPRQIRSRNAS